MIDNYDLHWALRPLQLQPEFLLQGGEYIRPSLKGRLAAVILALEPFLKLGICEFQLEIIESLESGLIEDRTLKHGRQNAD